MTPTPTGAELAHRVRTAARARGVEINDLLRPLTTTPYTWMNQLAKAENPLPSTIARVDALLAGQPIPPTRRIPEGRWLRGSGQKQQEELRADPRDPAIPPSIHRHPCPRCGVRGDLGCKHQRPEDFL